MIVLDDDNVLDYDNILDDVLLLELLLNVVVPQTPELDALLADRSYVSYNFCCLFGLSNFLCFNVVGNISFLNNAIGEEHVLLA